MGLTQRKLICRLLLSSNDKGDIMTVSDEHLSKSVVEQAHALIRKCRSQNLWFMREDYLPTDRAGLLRTMHSIENTGTRDVYIQARDIEQCLLQNSKKRSAN